MSFIYECFNAVFHVINNVTRVNRLAMVEDLEVINIVDKRCFSRGSCVCHGCNVEIEEKRAQKRTLWDTTMDVQSVGFVVIDLDELLPVGEV